MQPRRGVGGDQPLPCCDLSTLWGPARPSRENLVLFAPAFPIHCL